MARLPPVVSFIAPSGTGKTTLIEGVVRALRARGLRVGVLKHDAHRLELDKPGKDTWRFRKAGAWRSVIASAEQLAVFADLDGELSLAGIVDELLDGADIVLTEGFRRAGLPAIRVVRAARPADPDWGASNPILAWASDAPVPGAEAPVLPLDDPEAVADFLVKRFLPPEGRRAVTGVVPLAAGADLDRARRTVAALSAACEGRVLVVAAPGAPALPGVPVVHDLRPGLGPLGALLTALARVDTPDVLFAGISRAVPEPAMLAGLLRWGPRSADVVAPVHAGRPETCLALYGHRCLSAIQGALLGGEARMDGWWGQVRTFRVPEATWRAADPEARSFGAA